MIKERTKRCIGCSSCLRSIVLTIVRREFFSCNPLHSPVGGPGLCVCARIVDCDVVLQRIKVRTRDALDEMEFPGVWKSSIREPEFLIKVFRVDDQCIAFPAAKRAAIVGWEILIVGFQRSAVVVNHAPVVIAAADENKYPQLFAVFQKLNAIRK